MKIGSHTAERVDESASDTPGSLPDLTIPQDVFHTFPTPLVGALLAHSSEQPCEVAALLPCHRGGNLARATCIGSKAYAICFALVSRTFLSHCFLSPGIGKAFARKSNAQVLSCQFDRSEKIQANHVPSLGSIVS